jgi:heme-degrading monooxygenase HmoA
MTATLTIIRYRKRFIPFAILGMALFRFSFWFNKKIVFFKLMGSGKNGSFDKRPDWQQWAILSVSKSRYKQVQLKHYAADILLYKLYGAFITRWVKLFNCQTITYILQPIEGHGLWDKKMVFGELPHKTEYEGIIAVLTRATIRFSRLKHFWKHVDGVAKQMASAEGFITSYGIGEMPFIKQATFSIWQSKEAMKNFAYQTKEHQEVIQKTRQQKWYSEDMFTRFAITACTGSINGINPLKGKL